MKIPTKFNDTLAAKDRFARHEISNHENDLLKTGIVPNETEWLLGTASLERDETISLIGATVHSSERLLLRLKWRPAGAGEPAGPLVSCISELQFTTKSGQRLRYEQVESYTPEGEFNVAHGAASERKIIQQYGSSGSKLKLIILNPYRRLRLVFNGHMELLAGDGRATRFVRLGCVLTPCGQIFDFLAKGTKFNWTGAERDRGQLDTLLLLHDRHEQRVRFDGEIAIFAPDGAPERSEFTLRGFHVRHLLALDAKGEFHCNTARLYVALQNGKAFQLGVSWRELSEAAAAAEGAKGRPEPQRACLSFGYTQFALQPVTRTIVDFSTIDLEAIRHRETLLKELLIVHSQQDDEFLGCRVSEPAGQQWAHWMEAVGSPAMSEQERCQGALRAPLKGWAFWTQDDELLDSAQTVQLIRRNRQQRAEAIAAGQLIGPPLGHAHTSRLAPGPLVVSIEDDLCASSALVGSKAASLAQLLRFGNQFPALGYRVPRAVVLTRFSWDLVERENEALLKPLLAGLVDELTGGLAEARADSVRQKCDHLQRLVREQIGLPASIGEQLLQRLQRGGLERAASFAVRSSSWGEDEADMSAAGQLTTILNVQLATGERGPSELLAAVRACFASKFSYENIQYKRQHGLPLDLPMAVVVQEMVPCEKAGVMFTCDPVSGDESRLTITANFGLGESVVSAQAEPDSIRVAVDLEAAGERLSIEQVHIGRKERITGGCEQAAPAAAQHRSQECCLSEAEILHLARLARQLKRFYSSQQLHCDIEFGYLAGQLNLFQCRPVTGLEQWNEREAVHEFDRSSPSEINFFSRANLGEVLPYAMRPLTQTLTSCGIWNLLSAQMQLDYQPLRGALQPHDVFIPQWAMPDIVCEKYHLFFNLLASNFLHPGEPGSKDTLTRSLEIGMFGRELEEQADFVEATRGFAPLANPFAGLRFELKSARLAWNPLKCIDGLQARLELKYAALRAQLDQQAREARFECDAGRRAAKLVALYASLAHSSSEQYAAWSTHLICSLRSSQSNMAIMKLLSKYLSEPVKLSVVSNKLLALSRNVISAEIPARVRDIARLIEREPAPGAHAFLAQSEPEALGHLMKQAQFVEFLHKFGHRCYHEFDIATPRWHEEPERLLEMVRANLRASAGGQAEREPESSPAPPDSVDAVLESHGLLGKLSALDHFLLKQWLVPRAQLFLAARERSKNCVIQFVGCLRLWALQLGRELRAQLRLPDEQLVMFVPIDELESLCRAPRPGVVAHALRRRQLFKRLLPPDASSEPWTFDEIIRERDIVPNQLKARRALDRALSSAPKLTGTPASSGRVRARVCLVKNYHELGRLERGSILLTHSTDVAFSPVFPLLAGVITEVGGLISHGAVVAREYGLPCVIGIPDVTRILQDGEEVLLDADAGTIVRLAASDAAA